MSLRTRLFLLFGGLIAAFALAQGWLVRALSRDLELAVDDAAFRVSSSLVSLFLPAEGEPPTETSLAAPHPEHEPLRIVLVGESASEAVGTRIVTSKRFRFEETGRLVLPRIDLRSSSGKPAARGQPEITTIVDLELATSANGSPHDVFAIADVRAPLMPFEMELDGEAAGRARYIPIPREKMLATLEGFHSRLFLGSLLLFALAVAVAGWVAHRVSVPLRALARASTAVGTGRLGSQVEAHGDREVSTTIHAFNEMSQKLASLDAEASALREREHLGEIGELARGVAHSLRNPLHGLGLALEELASVAGGTRSRELADDARAQIRRIDRSLRSFLALSAAGAGAREEVSLEQLARDVVLEVLQDSRGRVRVELEARPGTPRIRGVAAELRAMVQALVVNAAEASPAGELVNVIVEPAFEGSSPGDPDSLCARVVIEDRGPGLAHGIRERLFTPHVTTKEQGSGLGLYLSRRIATSRYGGALALEDRAGGGTRAVLELCDREERARAE